MSRPKKIYHYYRYGNRRATGTIPELSKQLLMSKSKLAHLAGLGRSETLTADVRKGLVPEYLKLSHEIHAIYALYDGEQIEAEGSIGEIAEETGLKRQTIRWYGTPVGQKRGNKALVRIDEEEIEV